MRRGLADYRRVVEDFENTGTSGLNTISIANKLPRRQFHGEEVFKTFLISPAPTPLLAAAVPPHIKFMTKMEEIITR